MIRVNKFLAQAGIASRRAADELIARGAVTIDGRRAKPGDRVDPAVSDVRLNGKRVRNTAAKLGQAKDVTIALNKPLGVITTMRDERGRPNVGDFLRPELRSGTPGRLRLFPVGRLDAQTTGLLLCTTDGELCRDLTHPSREVERRYRVTVNSQPSEAALEALGASRLKTYSNGNLQFEIVLTRGQNREIRRTCAQHGLSVIALERFAFGPVQLGRLQPGASRALTDAELESLKRASARTRERS